MGHLGSEGARHWGIRADADKGENVRCSCAAAAGDGAAVSQRC